MNKRFKKGQIAEQCFKDLLNKKQIPFVKMGREFQIKNKQIESFLNKDNSPTAAAVRYSPDFLLLKNGLWFAEIKHSRTIEFNCYMNYKRLEESGCNVIIIFYINDNFYFCKPSQLVFERQKVNAAGLVAHIKTGLFIPCENKTWLCPGQMKEHEKIKLIKTTNGSGNKYGYISMFHILKMNKINND